MTTPATPPPPAPVPPELPEGYHIIPKDWLRTNLLPDDAIFTFSGNPWKPSHLRGFQLQSWEIETGGRFYATRAQIPPEPSGEDGPWAEGWKERSSSESSGYMDEVKETLANQIRYLQNDLAAERTKALAQEGLREAAKSVCDRLAWAIQFFSEKPFKPWDNAEEWLKWAVPELNAARALLATPSPAPVAGKTNPPEISSQVVDAPVAVGEKDCECCACGHRWHHSESGVHDCAAIKEKDSAGPTINYDVHPETDAFMTRIDDSSIDLDQVAAQMGGFEAERNFARQAIQIMLASARPHPTENPTMFEAWKRGKAALTPPVAGGEG